MVLPRSALYYILALFFALIPAGDFVTPAYPNYSRRSDEGYRSELYSCEHSSCYPLAGDLLIGRERQLYASSTCGLREPQRYCIVSHLDDRKKSCFYCDSRPTRTPKPLLNHNVSNIVPHFQDAHHGKRQRSWWQSENGKETVHIQLDFEAEFHFTHMIIKFKTFRPAAMLIERSSDFQKTWQVYRYFAKDCAQSFPGISTEPARNISDVVCDSSYSNLEPSTNGLVVHRVFPRHKHIDNPFSQPVQNMIKVTNLRINFTKLHTLGDDLLDRREEIQEKYYYAISDMIVRGSCSCYGHANLCLPLPGESPNSHPDKVHGLCKCTHNTQGRNCEKCSDFYNDQPWEPAVGKQTRACKKCNCNNHATSCHFDPAVYEASNKVSGGVCDGCQHNTMGTNCEQCKVFYYRDPLRDIQDPEVCKLCDCDPDGSLDGGICDPATDPDNNLVSGQCHCRTNIMGRRCDQCKNGYWDFDKENPDGCRACSCDTFGTVDNQGCNVYTGECTCKRYVTGRDCNQCFDEYYGLSEDAEGCKPCDCDPGGSLDNHCDVRTGQCKCRDWMSGLRCDTPQQQYYTPRLDYLLYEAEYAKGSSTCQVVIRESYRDGREDTWTGTGFMKALEDSYVEFNIDDVRTTMLYDIVLRYEPTTIDEWDDVELTLIRLDDGDNATGDDDKPTKGEGDADGWVNLGACSNADPADDRKTLQLSSHGRSVVASPPVCLEEGKRYIVRLDFRRSQVRNSGTPASILIDSIVLIPNIQSIPWFRGTPPAEARRKEYERECTTVYDLQTNKLSQMCQKYQNSIGAYIFHGALKCQCDPTGSISHLCDSSGGNCQCKKNVVGRRCDQCAAGTYGFGPEGCKACDCNSIGALDNFCNATTGQCKCRANTYGRECDQCRKGFWNFPNCQRCDCNGHADTCDSRTGACNNCQDFTEGHTCDQCLEGYYGDPRLSMDIACRPCPCPDTSASGHSFADRCYLDRSTQDVVCECREGYAGAKCDVCADNYYGNPDVPGGSCQPCQCNDRIDLLKPGNCDPHTGQCLQCLFETSGNHCETCRRGYYRTSPTDICRECICDPLGTNKTSVCDPESGQCPCLPSVEGRTCEQCAPNHWRIASGEGCDPCDCDPVGSVEPQCNLYHGQCDCKPNYGGRQCNECRADHWGDPKIDQCNECFCDVYGSLTPQCDRKTGECVCRPGIGGRNCNQCARGYLGDGTQCSPCGECFNNWDRILDELKNTTEVQMDRAKDIKKVGATGAYSKEFDQMKANLKEIDRVLNSTNSINVTAIEEFSVELRERAKDMEDGVVKELSNLQAKVAQNSSMINLRMQDALKAIDDLLEQIETLRRSGTAIQETNVQGALNLIKQARTNAMAAVNIAEASQGDIQYAERQCKATENLIATIRADMDSRRDEEDSNLRKLSEELVALTRTIPTMNSLVCDKEGDPCDDVCGGAGCGECGGSVSCNNGAKWMAETALSLASDTEKILKFKEAAANDFLRNVTAINTAAARQHAQEAFERARDAHSTSAAVATNITELKAQIERMLDTDDLDPAEIQKAAEAVLAMNIKLDPEEIKDLADKIKEAVDTLTNIEPIIQETEGDLRKVTVLKERANDAKSRVDEIKAISDEVKSALKNSSVIQDDAHDNITNLHEAVKNISQILSEIESKRVDMDKYIDKTDENIETLQVKLGNLRQNVTSNERTADTLRKSAAEIGASAQRSHDDLKRLESEYNSAMEKLRTQKDGVESAQSRASRLVDRAYRLTVAINKVQDNMVKMHTMPHGNTLEELQEELRILIARMTQYNERIQSRANHYQVCS